MAAEETKSQSKKKQPFWLVYFSLLLAGLLLLADAYHFAHLDWWTARLGIALIYSAVSLFIGNGRTAGFVAAAIVWIAVIATIFV